MGEDPHRRIREEKLWLSFPDTPEGFREKRQKGIPIGICLRRRKKGKKKGRASAGVSCSIKNRNEKKNRIETDWTPQ